MATKTTTKRRINKGFDQLGTYHPEVPLDELFAIIEENGHTVVQEDGTPWSGILCGEQGRMTALCVGEYKFYLQLSWYKMPSGRWEVVVYVS